MHIRRLQLADTQPYRALRLRALREHADAFTSSFEEENLRPVADTEKRLAGSDKLWGAFIDSTLVGMVGLSFEPRLKNRHKATLVSMYVAPEVAGRGIGRALVATVLQDARTAGVSRVVLTVTEGNQAATALYQQAGFSAFGTEPDAIRVQGRSFGKTHMAITVQPEPSTTMSIHSFAFPTPIKFGAGARKLVAQHLIDQGLQRPLIVTDRALAALPVMAEFVSHLNGLVVAVYSGVHGNPTCSQVMEGAEAFKAHNADCVIGFGGGAALDVAKVVGIPATHPGDILEYVWDHPQVRPIRQPLPYFVAVPTTSGTGSEVGRSSVVSENDTHLKRVVFSAHILAKTVFADPELTLGLPAHVTAATGMDALTHNIESYLSPAYHPLCDGIALEGVRIAAAALRTAVHEPSNLQARSDMMMASMMGAIAFQKDLGAVHSCAHALGAVCDLHHGLANALMIDTVLVWNQVAVPNKFDELAHVCKLAGGGKAFVPWLRELKQDIGITGRLADHGVHSEHLPRLVEIATADMCHQTNPRPCTAEDFENLFKAAL
nr:iron-containing alcohol dehydrogenase [uncultured Albidiferax sp.]